MGFKELLFLVWNIKRHQDKDSRVTIHVFFQKEVEIPKLFC